MFGQHDMPLKIDRGGISLLVEEEGEGFVYTRESGDERVEKRLLTKTGKLLA